MNNTVKSPLAIFELPGFGRVIADLSNEKLQPIVQFCDGTACFGLPRSAAEVAPLGYGAESVAEANFIHEALHLFIASKCGFVETSVAYRAGHSADFEDPQILEDAKHEEQVILGFQALINDALGDGLTTNKVSGFVFHLTNAAINWSDHLLRTKYNLDINDLRDEFLAILGETRG